MVTLKGESEARPCLLVCGTVSSSYLRDFYSRVGVTLSFSAHISNLSQSSSYHLCSLHAIRRSVFMPTLSSMVHMPLSVPGLTIVTPSSFAHQSPAQLHFSAILNASTCLIAHTSGFSHVSTFIKEKLHWLPLSARILFRIFFLI